jgi:hypothetical protein
MGDDTMWGLPCSGGVTTTARSSMDAGPSSEPSNRRCRARSRRIASRIASRSRCRWDLVQRRQTNGRFAAAVLASSSPPSPSHSPIHDPTPPPYTSSNNAWATGAAHRLSVPCSCPAVGVGPAALRGGWASTGMGVNTTGCPSPRDPWVEGGWPLPVPRLSCPLDGGSTRSPGRGPANNQVQAWGGGVTGGGSGVGGQGANTGHPIMFKLREAQAAAMKYETLPSPPSHTHKRMHKYHDDHGAARQGRAPRLARRCWCWWVYALTQ